MLQDATGRSRLPARSRPVALPRPRYRSVVCVPWLTTENDRAAILRDDAQLYDLPVAVRRGSPSGQTVDAQRRVLSRSAAMALTEFSREGIRGGSGLLEMAERRTDAAVERLVVGEVGGLGDGALVVRFDGVAGPGPARAQAVRRGACRRVQEEFGGVTVVEL